MKYSNAQKSPPCGTHRKAIVWVIKKSSIGQYDSLERPAHPISAPSQENEPGSTDWILPQPGPPGMTTFNVQTGSM